MQIENGVVQGLELETGFVTSAEISQMESSLQFMNSYKWEMGEVNAIYLKKQLLSNQVGPNGKRIPYKGSVSEAGRKILLAEGYKEEEITQELLFSRFNNDTDLQALSEFVRGILVHRNGKTMTQKVLNPVIKDEHGKRIKTTLDEVANLTNAIHQKKRDEQEAKLKQSGIGEDVIKTTLTNFDSAHKMIKATKPRVAMEICVVPVDPVKHTVKEDKYEGLKGVIYTISVDVYNKLKNKLHTPDDVNLDFLEIKITHPTVNKGNKDVSKMHSAMQTEYETFKSEYSPANTIPDFKKNYVEYCTTSAQSADDLRAKVMDYREISDEELLTLCKDYVINNYDTLTDEEKEKYHATVQRFQEVLTAEEIAKASNINFAPSPDVMQAEGMNGITEETPFGEGGFGDGNGFESGSFDIEQ